MAVPPHRCSFCLFFFSGLIFPSRVLALLLLLTPMHRFLVLRARPRVGKQLCCAAPHRCVSLKASETLETPSPLASFHGEHPSNEVSVSEAAAPRHKNRGKKVARTTSGQISTAAASPAAVYDATAAVSSSSASPSLPRPRSVLDLPMAYRPFPNAMPIASFRATYDSIEAGQMCSDAGPIRVGGRVIGVRDMGRILFLTIRSGDGVLQVVQRVGEHTTKQALRSLRDTLRIGDIVGAEGIPGRTSKGELSLYASQLHILAPYVCADQTLCPDLKGFTPLADTDIKYRYRFVDMMSNPKSTMQFVKRHAITKALRNYLDHLGFVEVETPVLHAVASGANAKPFVTHHNANKADLYLRVAPELHLKQCVVGGLDRVYEIGRVFRNEDADRSHNPEFTSCEFYAAYHTYEDLMTLTEELFQRLAIAANNSTKLLVTSCETKAPVELDFSQPFRRVSAYDEVQRASGVELPPPLELSTPRGMAYLSAIMLRYSIPLPSVRTASKMFDKLIDFFITDHVVEPTFVMDHPLFMSPLAMERADRPGLSARFELFINGVEYCNAYNELSDPQEQYFRFQQQMVDRQTGDEEAMELDETFLKALQTGLPPTAGWGMGIDRVVALLNGSPTIRDSILFPLLRYDTASHDAKRRRKTASFFGMNHSMTLFCLSALEEEMIKKVAPQEALDKVQHLRHYITKMNQCTAANTSLDDASIPSGWRYEMTMAVLRFCCCRGKY